MNKQNALELVARLQAAIESSAWPAAVDGLPSACACPHDGGAAPAFDDTSAPQMLHRLAAAAMLPLPDEAGAERQHVGTALAQAAAALGAGAETLRDLGAGADPAQARLAENLAADLERAALVFQQAAAWGWNEGDAALDIDDARVAEAALHDAAGLMADAPALRGNGSARAHASAMLSLAGAWSDLLVALAAKPAEPKVVALCHAQCGAVGASALSLLAACALFGRTVSVPQPTLGCTAPCPHQGCTRYCHDAYVNPVGCTPWVKVPAGLFTSGGWSSTCTWTVRAEVKDVCCYRSRWDRFWAVDDCRCTTRLVRTGQRVARHTWKSATRVAPVAPPPKFIVSTGC